MNKRSIRIMMTIEGLVQGVGFRPFVERLARRHQLTGRVNNCGQAVQLEVQGATRVVDNFRRQLQAESLAGQRWFIGEERPLAPRPERGFKISVSAAIGGQRLPLTPDQATCPQCRRELADSADRRFGYPFISCARCGPRYAIATAAPFDRERTTLARFPRCTACEDEYQTLENRRYHAQTISCAECGPQLHWCGADGRVTAQTEPLTVAAKQLLGGGVVAIKAVSGFHLVCRAADHQAVARLRGLKNRPKQPLAVMYPSVEQLRTRCYLSTAEAQWLTGPAAPIVLLDKLEGGAEPGGRATQGSPRIGAMLPGCGTHLLLLARLAEPLVMTSLNRPGAPVIYRNSAAVEQFGGEVDGFLLHDLDIHHGQDDSIVQRVAGTMMVLRRARGYAPTTLAVDGPGALIAAGARLKNSVAVQHSGRVVVSPPLGDLENLEVIERHRQVLESLVANPREVTLLEELHPDMAAPFRRRYGRTFAVQHHRAHARAVQLEHGLDEPHLAVVWDGLGYGDDGTFWGGEWFEMAGGEAVHAGRFRPFLLPGGRAAVTQNSRVALSLIGQAGDEQDMASFCQRLALDQPAVKALRQLLEKQIASPVCSSAGRFIEGCASLLGLVHQNEFEGDAASALQYAAERADRAATLPALSWQRVNEPDSKPGAQSALKPGWELDWRPLVQALVQTPWHPAAVERAALAVHQRLAEAIIDIADRLTFKVLTLSGGCFQNRLLVEQVKLAADQHQLRSYWPQRFSPNDSSISLGQIAYHLDQQRAGKSGR